MDVFSLSASLTLDSSDFDKGLQSGESRLKGFGQKLTGGAGKAVKAVGSAAVEAGKATVDFVKDSVETGKEFDAAMAKVAAISGATGADYEALRNKAIEMGSTTVFTATEAAEAMQYMAMAGWKTEQIISGIPGVMDLAAASGESLGTTSDILTDAMTAFGLKAKDSTHFANLLAVASSNANTNVYLMGQTFKYVAPVAGSLGVSAEDTAEAIGLIANQGIKASQAGTALRSILTRLATNAGASNTSLGALDILTEELGVQFYDTEGKVRDFSDVIDEARKAWQGLSQEDQATFAKKIAGQNAISSWLALMNSTEEDIEKLRTGIEGADEGGGAAANMASTMLDNLEGDVTLLNSALEGLKILISDDFKDKIRDFVQALTSEVGKLSEAFKEGGLAGVLIELGDWVINGITDAITAEGTSEKAAEIGKSIGDFVARTLKTLISNAPALLQAGASLAEGLISGLWEGMKPLVDDVVKWLQDNIFSPIQGFFDTYILGPVRKVIEFIKRTANTISNFLGLGDAFDMDEDKDPETLAAEQEEYSKIAAEKRAEAIEKANKLLSEDPLLRQLTGMDKIDESGNLLEQIAKLSDFPALGLDDETQEIFDLAVEAEEAAGKADKAAKKLDSLGESAASAATDVNALNTALNNLPDNVNVNMNGDGQPHAKGSPYIPYDNYPAMLHRGEMVLTASQARKYRDGGENTFPGMLSSITAAVKAGVEGATVKSFLNGKDITDEVSRVMGNALKSRRYAT